MKEACIIIDVQLDYFKHGKCELWNTDETLAVIKQLQEMCREQDIPIYYVQHIADETAAFFAKNSSGVEINKDLKPMSCEEILKKHTPNCFYQTKLHADLQKKGITDVILCGMMTHMCVDTTVRCARDLGYHVVLLSDACTTKDLTWKDKTIPAKTVQDVYLASLQGKFAEVLTFLEFSKRRSR